MHSSSKNSLVRLKDLLMAVAPTKKTAERIAKVFDPAETLRVVVLEQTFRPSGLSGNDPLIRRTKLWNVRGHLWLEAETWDYAGAHFERDLAPIARIAESANLQIQCSLRPEQIEFAAHLQEKSEMDAQAQLTNLRVRAHTECELTLSELAARFAGKARFTNDDNVRHEIPHAKDVQLWIDPTSLFDLAVCSPTSRLVKQVAARPGGRCVLSETLAGQPGDLTHHVRPDGPGRYIVTERYLSEATRQEIVRTFPTQFSGDGPGAYFPLETLEALLAEQTTWTHWRYQPHRTVTDEGTFLRSIHPSSDYHKIREYLGKTQPQAWHNRINEACKTNAFALVLSASLHPIANSQISRKLQISRAKTQLTRLIYHGGLLCGFFVKHSWLFNWVTRPNEADITTAVA